MLCHRHPPTVSTSHHHVLRQRAGDWFVCLSRCRISLPPTPLGFFPSQLSYVSFVNPTLGTGFILVWFLFGCCRKNGVQGTCRSNFPLISHTPKFCPSNAECDEAFFRGPNCESGYLYVVYVLSQPLDPHSQRGNKGFYLAGGPSAEKSVHMYILSTLYTP